MQLYMTFMQAKEAGASILRGEKSFPVVYWNFSVKDKNGHKITIDDYRKLSEEEKQEYKVTPYMKTYNVFNISQTNYAEIQPEKWEKLKSQFSTPSLRDEKDMYTMPLMSLFMCLSLPVALGVYWTASALFQWIQQMMFHAYYNHADMDKIIAKSREKAAKKKKKKGPSMYERMLGASAQQQTQGGDIKKSANVKSTKNVAYTGNSKGGIASKANALNRKKGGK